MSRTFSTNSGSVESLKVSLRCGCSENAFQMRWTVEGARPEALAIVRELQWVQPAGRLSSVAVTTSATFASLTVRGAPGRGSSRSPSRRRSAKRLRQVATVTRVTPRRAAIATLLRPSAASRTISARIASPRPTLPTPQSRRQRRTLRLRQLDENRRSPRHVSSPCLRRSESRIKRYEQRALGRVTSSRAGDERAPPAKAG
jgi:hypothetical protein